MSSDQSARPFGHEKGTRSGVPCRAQKGEALARCPPSRLVSQIAGNRRGRQASLQNVQALKLYGAEPRTGAQPQQLKAGRQVLTPLELQAHLPGDVERPVDVGASEPVRLAAPWPRAEGWSTSAAELGASVRVSLFSGAGAAARVGALDLRGVGDADLRSLTRRGSLSAKAVLEAYDSSVVTTRMPSASAL